MRRCSRFGEIIGDRPEGGVREARLEVAEVEGNAARKSFGLALSKRFSSVSGPTTGLALGGTSTPKPVLSTSMDFGARLSVLSPSMTPWLDPVIFAKARSAAQDG